MCTVCGTSNASLKSSSQRNRNSWGGKSCLIEKLPLLQRKSWQHMECDYIQLHSPQCTVPAQGTYHQNSSRPTTKQQAAAAVVDLKNRRIGGSKSQTDLPPRLAHPKPAPQRWQLGQVSNRPTTKQQAAAAAEHRSGIADTGGGKSCPAANDQSAHAQPMRPKGKGDCLVGCLVPRA